jgi:hypothetical protein
VLPDVRLRFSPFGPTETLDDSMVV